jgi:hypothetical protein
MGRAWQPARPADNRDRNAHTSQPEHPACATGRGLVASSSVSGSAEPPGAGCGNWTLHIPDLAGPGNVSITDSGAVIASPIRPLIVGFAAGRLRICRRSYALGETSRLPDVTHSWRRPSIRPGGNSGRKIGSFHRTKPILSVPEDRGGQEWW